MYNNHNYNTKTSCLPIRKDKYTTINKLFTCYKSGNKPKYKTQPKTTHK